MMGISIIIFSYSTLVVLIRKPLTIFEMRISAINVHNFGRNALANLIKSIMLMHQIVRNLVSNNASCDYIKG